MFELCRQETGLNAPGFVLIPNKFKAVYFEPKCWIQAMLWFGFAVCVNTLKREIRFVEEAININRRGVE